LGILHPGSVPDPTVEPTDTPSFDGGPRGQRPPRYLRTPVYREPGGWHGIEIEDGSRLFFPWLE
jgi:hypothetical protein